jgi:Zn-dependent metalloprotease
MKKLTMIAFLLAIIIVSANSQTPGKYIHNPKGAIAEEFGEGNVTGIKYAENGLVESIAGSLDKGITAVDPLEKCYEFFELHKHLFGLDNSRDELVFLGKSGSFPIYKFRQYYNGVQIGTHRIMVSFSLDDKYSINGAWGEFVTKVKSLSSSPAISEEEAIRIATNEYIAQKYEVEPKSGKAKLRYLKVKDGSYYLAWIISISYRGYHIDAMTGEVRKSFNNFSE